MVFDRVAACLVVREEARARGAPPPDERRAAVALVLRERESSLDLLLMRRIERPGDRWSGQISLPGGHEEETDAGLVQTAIRETREEVGLDLEVDARVLGRMQRLQAKARGRKVAMGITPFVFGYHGEDEPVPGEEADEAFWFPLDRAQRGELTATHTYEHEGLSYRLPAWNFEGRVIWGMTHEMVSTFLRMTATD